MCIRDSVETPNGGRDRSTGRVERQVNIDRDHVIAGRMFDSISELVSRV